MIWNESNFEKDEDRRELQRNNYGRLLSIAISLILSMNLLVASLKESSFSFKMQQTQIFSLASVCLKSNNTDLAN